MKKINNVGNFNKSVSETISFTESSSNIAYPEKYINGFRINYAPFNTNNYYRLYGLSTYSNNEFSFTASASQFIESNVVFTPGSNPWKIKVAVMVTNFAAIRALVQNASPNSTSTYSGFALQFNTAGKLLVYLSSNGSTWNLASAASGSKTYIAGTKYYITFEFTGTQYIIKWSEDNITYNTDYTLNSTTSLYQFNYFVLRYGLNLSKIYPMLGTIDVSKNSYTVNGVEQLTAWNPETPIINKGECRGILNVNNISLNSSYYKKLLTNYVSGINNGAYVQYDTHTSVVASTTYSLFLITNGTVTDLISIHNLAHTNGILNSDAIDDINSQTSLTITDYRYLGDMKTNAYSTPFLDRYLKDYNNNSKFISEDILSGDFTIDGLKTDWTRATISGAITTYLTT